MEFILLETHPLSFSISPFYNRNIYPMPLPHGILVADNCLVSQINIWRGILLQNESYPKYYFRVNAETN